MPKHLVHSVLLPFLQTSTTIYPFCRCSSSFLFWVQLLSQWISELAVLPPEANNPSVTYSVSVDFYIFFTFKCHFNLTSSGFNYYWLSAMYFRLPNIVRDKYIQQLSSEFSSPVQSVVGICKADQISYPTFSSKQ